VYETQQTAATSLAEFPEQAVEAANVARAVGPSNRWLARSLYFSWPLHGCHLPGGVPPKRA